MIAFSTFGSTASNGTWPISTDRALDCTRTHTFYNTQLPYPMRFSPRRDNLSWMRQELTKVEKERIRYPRRADLKLRSMELQKAIKAVTRR